MPRERGAANDNYSNLPRPVAALGLEAMLLPRRLTAGRRRLPDFLIIGGQRCGTTSLYRYLVAHPGVVGAYPSKGAHYFDKHASRSLGWYRAHFPLARDGGPITGEGSPYYMFHPLAAERINRDLPGVRVIALLRDPVERAYSAHSNQFGMGHEKEPFERALELEDARLAGEQERLASDPTYYSRRHWLFSYRTRGHYIEQLERMERVFGRERMHVIDSGDFFADPQTTYHQTLDFLGIPRLGNPTFTPKNGRTRSPMPESLRASLEEHYRPYDERLAVWLGREPSWRRGD